jgi:hypothetical protein
MSRGRCCCRHHARGAAVIEVGPGPELAQRRGDVETLGGIAAIVVKHHPSHSGENCEIVEKRRFLGLSGAIVQQEIGVTAA